MKKIRMSIISGFSHLFKWLPERFCVSTIFAITWFLVAGREPKEGLRIVLQLNNRIYKLTSKLACDYGNGLHPKHRLIAYHNFFVKHLNSGAKVIDIGCGNGALTYDMAESAGVEVTGIELNSQNYKMAVENYSHSNVQYVLGDALKDLPERAFDVAVMSNVLEHLENRVDFLREAQMKLNPKRWLLRVPLYERDWRVPLMKELGLDYRLDSTHFIEYTREQFVNELEQAGLIITHDEIRWGEIWCEAKPKV